MQKTWFLTGGSIGLPDAVGPAYAAPAEAYHERLRAMVAVVESDDPSLRLLLGHDAWEMAQEKLARLRRDLDAWKDVTPGTSFDA